MDTIYRCKVFINMLFVSTVCVSMSAVQVILIVLSHDKKAKLEPHSPPSAQRCEHIVNIHSPHALPSLKSSK